MHKIKFNTALINNKFNIFVFTIEKTTFKYICIYNIMQQNKNHLIIKNVRLKNPLSRSLIAFLIIVLNGCNVIHINENDRWTLKDTEKEFIQPFNIGLYSHRLNNTKDLFLYEINSDNIRQCLTQHDYMWIHFWDPKCSGTNCLNLNYMADIPAKFKAFDMGVLLISEYYDYSSIRHVIENSDYTEPLFVMQNEYYGPKVRPARLKFYNDFKNDNSPQTKWGFREYFFRDTVLMYSGSNITYQQIDSLLHVNQ